MPRGLPLIGVEAVVLGMGAFNANHKTVTSAFRQMAQSAFFLERSTARASNSIGSSFTGAARAAQQASQSTAKALAMQSRAAEIAARVQLQNQRATEAAANARIKASLQVQAAQIQEQRAALAINAASARYLASRQQSAQAQVQANQQVTRANLQLQSAQLATARATQASNQAMSQSRATATANAIRNAQVQAAAVVASEAAQQAAMAKTASAATARAAIVAAATTAILVAITAVIAAMGAAEAAAAKYNAEVAFIGAVSQAPTQAVMQLSDAQLELARNSTQSANNLALASQELLKAGVPIKDVTEDVLEAVNNLVVASKGELEAAKAATLVQVAVKGFGTDAKRAADIATGAVQTSTLSFNEFADAMRQGGGVLSSFGVNIEQFGAIVSVVGQQIKSGTEVGTGLRVMFQRLQAPSAQAKELMQQYGISLYDAAGNARPLFDVLKSLEDAFGKNADGTYKLVQAERDHAVATIFGARSSKILEAVLDEGTEGYLRQLDAVQRLKAADMAGEVLAPTAAQAQILRNQIEVLGIAFGQGLDPLVQHAYMSLNKWLNETLRIEDVRAFGEALSNYIFNSFMNVAVSIGNAIQDIGDFFNAILMIEHAFAQFFVRVANAAWNFAQNVGAALASVFNHIVNIDRAMRKGFGGLGELQTSVQAFANDIPNIIAKAGEAVGVLDTNLDSSVQLFKDALGGIDFKQSVFEWKDYAAEARGAIKSIADERDKRISGAGPRGGVERPDSESEAGFLPDSGDLDKEAKKIADTLDKLGEVQRDFNDDLVKASDSASEEVTKLYQRAFSEIVEALLKNQAAVQEAMTEAEEALAELEEERTRERTRDMETALLEQQIAEQRSLWDKAAEDSAIVFTRMREDEERERRLSTEDLQQQIAFRREMQEKYINDVLAAQARARTVTRQDEDRQFDASQAARESELDAQLSALERQLKAEQELREDALDERLEAEKRALEKSQDIRERALKAEFDREDIARDRAQAQAEFQQEIARGVKQSIAQARLNEKLGDIDKKSQENQIEQDQQSRLEALREQFETEDIAFEKYAHGEKLKLETQHQQELTNLEADHIRQRITLENTLRDEQRARERQRAEEDRLYDEQQEATRRAALGKLDAEDRARKRQEEEKEIARARLDEDQERQRKARQDAVADMNRRMQEERLRMLEIKHEQEDHQLRIDNIHKERDERIAAANQALTEEQEKSREKLAQDLLDLKENLADKIASLRENYVDRLDDIARDGGAAIEPAVTDLTNKIASGLDKIRDSAAAAVEKLAEAFGVAEKLNFETAKAGNTEITSPADWHADYNFAKGMGQSDDDARRYADSFQNKQYGGVVQGPYGSPQLVMAHGGERFEGLGAYNIASTAVRAAESMVRSGIGGATSTTNNYNYNVNASYGRVQPEGTVRQDLSALVTMTRS